MASLLKTYNRPKDYLSDDESVDEQKMTNSDGQSVSITSSPTPGATGSPTPSSPTTSSPTTSPTASPTTSSSTWSPTASPTSSTTKLQKTSDSNNVLRKGYQIPKSSLIPSQNGKGVFTDKGINCQSGLSIGSNEDSVGDGIMLRCSSLRRLIEGLKCYDAIKDDPESLMDFIANQYRVEMIDDFNHFVAEHEHQSNEIVHEMIAVHHFKPCDVEHCAHSQRHFDETRRVSPYPSKPSQIGGDDSSSSKLLAFYSPKYDALHFALFHIFETGYRYQLPRRPQTEDLDDDDEKVAQQEFAEAISAINTGRDRCRGALGRFESESNNKFNLSVGVGAESKTEDGHSVKTTTDSMMEYAASNGVGHDALVQINGFMVREDIDTDAAKDDVADSKEESNLYTVTKHCDAFLTVKRYFTLSTGMQSVGNVFSLSVTVFCSLHHWQSLISLLYT